MKFLLGLLNKQPSLWVLTLCDVWSLRKSTPSPFPNLVKQLVTSYRILEFCGSSFEKSALVTMIYFLSWSASCSFHFMLISLSFPLCGMPLPHWLLDTQDSKFVQIPPLNPFTIPYTAIHSTYHSCAWIINNIIYHLYIIYIIYHYKMIYHHFLLFGHKQQDGRAHVSLN